MGENRAFFTGGYRFQGYRWFFSLCPRTSLPRAVPTVPRTAWQTEPHLQHLPPSPTEDPSISLTLQFFFNQMQVFNTVQYI